MNRLRNIKVKSGIQLKVILYLVSGDPDNNLESRQWLAVDFFQLRKKFQVSVLELSWEYVLELLIP